MDFFARTGLPGPVSFFLLAVVALCAFAPTFADGWREDVQWHGREKTLRSGLRAGQVIQHIAYKSFFTRHLLVECFEGVDGFAISLGWSEISIDGSQPVLYSVDARKPGLLPRLAYNAEHFVQMPTEAERSVDIVAAFIRGLEVAFWTRDWSNVEYEHPYSLKGFTGELEKACGWHPALPTARVAARKIKYE